MAGSRFHVFGGDAGGTADSYDPVTGTWRSEPPSPTDRIWFGISELAGRIHLIGGSARSGNRLPWQLPVVDTHAVFDPADGTWGTLAPLPIALADVTATVAFEGRIYVFGGWDGTGVVATTHVYDPATDSWTTAAPVPTPRSSALAGVIGGRIAVIGGLDVDPARREYLDVVEVYDPATDTWCLGPVKPTPASQMAIAAPADGDRIHALGTGHPVGDAHEALFLAAADRDPPQIACPADLTLECPADPAAIEAWRLGAVASDECSTVTVESVVIDHRPGCGPTWSDRYRFTATDSFGNAASCEATLTLVDTAPPAVAPDPDGALCLWPPNHRLVCLGEESIGPRVVDTCDPAPAWRYTGCASSQPDDAPAGGWNGDGRTRADCVLPPPGERFCVRAERAGHGPDAREGRRYTVTVVAEDACGNRSTETEVGTVDVPHDASGGGSCLSARPPVKRAGPRLNGAAPPGIRSREEVAR